MTSLERQVWKGAPEVQEAFMVTQWISSINFLVEASQAFKEVCMHCSLWPGSFGS